MKIIYLLIFVLTISCNEPEKKLIRTPEQIASIKSDTAFLGFRIGMDKVEYNRQLLKVLKNKKLVEMTDGSYKYELEIDERKYYGGIVMAFYKDTLARVIVNFSTISFEDLKKYLAIKYGEPEYEKTLFEQYSWKETLDNYDNKSITIKKYSYGDIEIEYTRLNLWLKWYDEVEKNKSEKKDSLSKKYAKDL